MKLPGSAGPRSKLPVNTIAAETRLKSRGSFRWDRVVSFSTFGDMQTAATNAKPWLRRLSSHVQLREQRGHKSTASLRRETWQPLQRLPVARAVPWQTPSPSILPSLRSPCAAHLACPAPSRKSWKTPRKPAWPKFPLPVHPCRSPFSSPENSPRWSADGRTRQAGLLAGRSR